MIKRGRFVAIWRRTRPRRLVLLLSSLGLIAAVPTTGSATSPSEPRPPASLNDAGPSIAERVQAVREAFGKADPADQRYGAFRRFAQYWVNWPNWSNGWLNWGNF